MVRFALASLVVLLLAGCGGGPSQTDSWTSRPKTVKVQWLGNQSFLITSPLGTRILTNPFAPGSVPHTFPRGLQPEILLISHEERDANFTQAVENFPTTLRSSVGMGAHSAFGVRFQGIPIFPGSDRDIGSMNLIFNWTLDGVKFCFLGDLPRALELSEVSALRPVDVLFLPVGGALTPTNRDNLLAQLHPRLVIPMGRAGAVASFLSGFPQVFQSGSSTVLVNAATLPAIPTAIALDAP